MLSTVRQVTICRNSVRSAISSGEQSSGRARLVSSTISFSVMAG